MMEYLQLAVLLLISIQCNAAAYGTEFYVMFLLNEVEIFENDTIDALALLITNPSNSLTTTVTISVPNEPRWFPITFAMQTRSTERIMLPLFVMHRREGLDNKGILIVSSRDITVTGINRLKFSTDSFLALPYSSLGVSYTGICHMANIRTQIGFVATLDKTRVVITLPESPVPFEVYVEHLGQYYANGDRFIVHLDKHQTFLMSTRGDLTGTQIRSNRRIAAFSGNVRAKFDGKSRDHLVEQLIPIFAWGTDYYSYSTPGSPVSDGYKVLAMHPNTEVHIFSSESAYNGHIVVIPQTDLFSFISHIPQDIAMHFRCTKACMVYKISGSVEKGEGNGDPSLLTIPHPGLWLNKYNFMPPLTSFNDEFESFITIVMPVDDELLDGVTNASISPYWMPAPGSGYKIAVIGLVAAGNVELISRDGARFGAVLSGGSDRESYAHPLGMDISSPACQESVLSMVPGDGVDNDCDDFFDEEIINGMDDDGDGNVDEDAQLSRVALSSGREYIIMFMENRVERVNHIPLEIFIGGLSEKGITNVTVSYLNEKHEMVAFTTYLHPREVHKAELNYTIMQKGTGKDTKAIKVMADRDIVVYGINKEQYSADGFLALPIHVLGKEYFTVSYFPPTTATEFAVIAIKNNTIVNMTFPRVTHSTETISVRYEGQLYTNEQILQVTMNAFETLQIQTMGPNHGDLSGTYIHATENVAVFSGNVRTFVHTGLSGNSRDHLVEQLPPLPSYGKSFATMTTPNRTLGDVYKLITSVDDTTIDICQRYTNPPRLNCFSELVTCKGCHIELNVTQSPMYMYINASHPIMTAQITRSQARLNNGITENADPAMMIIPPVEQYSTNYTFLLPAVSNPDVVMDYVFHWCMVIVDHSKRNGFILDGDKTAFDNVQWESIPPSTLVAGYVQLPFALHFLTHSDPTATYMGLLYGVADRESYGFPIGLKLDKLDFCTETEMIGGDGIDNDCDSQVDEEVCDNGYDDDNDGRFDEDCSSLPSAYSYYVVFMDNIVESPVGYPLRLYAAPPVEFYARIQTPLYFWNSTDVHNYFADGQTYDRNVLVSMEEGLQFGLRPGLRHIGSGISNKGVLVRSDYYINLYGSNKEKFSHDAFLIFEKSLLGTKYYTVHQNQSFLPEEFAFTPVEDNTRVTISLPIGMTGIVNFDGDIYTAGTVFTQVLDVGQTAQIQLDGSGLSGTYVDAEKPIALFSGNVRSYVGSSKSRDHLVEQMLPTDFWGQEYVAPTSPGRTEPDSFVLLCAQAMTTVEVYFPNGLQQTYSMRGGEPLQLKLPTSNATYEFRASAPIQVVRFTHSQTSFYELADPSMMLIIPSHLYCSELHFMPPVYSGGNDGGDYSNTLQLIVPSTEVNGMRLNGKEIRTSWHPAPLGDFSYTMVALPNKERKFTVNHVSGSRFMAYLYGSADRESYALALGVEPPSWL